MAVASLAGKKLPSSVSRCTITCTALQRGHKPDPRSDSRAGRLPSTPAVTLASSYSKILPDFQFRLYAQQSLCTISHASFKISCKDSSNYFRCVTAFSTLLIVLAKTWVCPLKGEWGGVHFISANILCQHIFLKRYLLYLKDRSTSPELLYKMPNCIK